MKISMFKYIAPFRFSMLLFSMLGCESMLDVQPQRSTLEKSDVFSNDATATAAVTGIYTSMYSDGAGFLSGTAGSFGPISALSADEFDYYALSAEHVAFRNCELIASNSVVLGLWKSMYRVVYEANNAIQGLTGSKSISPTVKEQLLGEALFMRAFSYFYLVNTFGHVPLLIGTDYNANSQVGRSPVHLVYAQIRNDLDVAVELLSQAYIDNSRTRPNKAVATALLARVALYNGDWENAVKYSAMIIDDPRFALEPLNDAFLSFSKEAIWQLMPIGMYENTNEGYLYILQSAPLYSDHPYALSQELLDAFEPSDERKVSWIGSISVDGTEYAYPFKYKVAYGGSATDPSVPLSEYSMVFRLAELYLIRAEARAHLDNLDAALDDLDTIRGRANLLPLDRSVSGQSEETVLAAVEQERRSELFSEGHRWLDLKRTGRAEIYLSGKMNWSTDCLLYPVPQIEIERNRALKPQNDGY